MTEKATLGLRNVFGGGMFGRQDGVSGETWLLFAMRSGVRALIVPQRCERRDVGVAKPGGGKVGRKMDVGCPD